MSNLLPTTVVAIGTSAGMLGVAFAEAPAAPAQKQIIQVEIGASGANTNNNFQAATLSGGVKNPTPGTMVVRFNGRLWTEIGLGSGNGYVAPGFKANPYSIGTYVRLFPGVDAMASNGLRYGAQAEIRENFVAISSGSNTTVGSGNNALASTSQTGGSPLTCGQTLYVRRAFAYVSGADWGLIRMGQTDGITGIFDNGLATGQQVGEGLWNGDAPGWVSDPGSVTFPWLSQQGADYGSNKIVYLSPQFSGFDLGVEWAANNGNQESGGFTASSGDPQLSASTVLGDGARFTNMYKLGLRYQGTFGPVAVYGFGAYIGSGHVQFNGAPPLPAVPGATYNGRFKSLGAGFIGAEITYAGFSVGGAWQGGQYNEVMALAPQNGTNAQAWLINVLWTSGPYDIGATYYQFDDQGAVALTGISQQHQNAFGLGGDYQVSPGLRFFFEYLYGQRHQGSFNYVSGAAGSSLNNNVHTQAFMVGTQVGW